MKKALLPAIFCMALSLTVNAKTGVKPNLKKDGPVDCYGGITSCGTAYNFCFSGGPQPVTYDKIFAVAELMELINCE